jgi:hypothetical protein
MFVSVRSRRRPCAYADQAPRAPRKGVRRCPQTSRCCPCYDPLVQRIPHGPFEAVSGLRAGEPNPLTRDTKEKHVTLGTILLIVLVLMLVGAFPRWSHSRSWGYGPSGGLGLVLVVVVVLLLMGRI